MYVGGANFSVGNIYSRSVPKNRPTVFAHYRMKNPVSTPATRALISLSATSGS
jgi:hypothetical protein